MSMPKRNFTITTVNRVVRRLVDVPVTKQIIQCERPYVLFGEAVIDARHKLGWTQLDLSKKIGLSRGSIANIERGRQRILLDDIFTFAKVLKVDPKELFERTCK